MYDLGHHDFVYRDHARRVARVNTEGWKKWTGPARPSARARLGTFMIVLGNRLAPTAPRDQRAEAQVLLPPVRP
jgi:hypothetical protein